MVETKAEFLFFTKRQLANIKENLEEIKKITESKKLVQEAFDYYRTQRDNFTELKDWYDKNNLYEEGNSSDNKKIEDSYKELEKLVSELKSLSDKVYCNWCQKEINNPYHYSQEEVWKPDFCSSDCLLKSKSSSKEVNNIPANEKVRNNHGILICEKCQSIIKTEKFWIHPSKNDEKKFCSIVHYNRYYNIREREREREREQKPQNASIFCPHCKQKINTELIWEEENAHDDKEFCSKKCCLNYYDLNPFCDNCGKVYSNSFSWITWENAQEHEKLFAKYLETQLNKKIQKDYNQKYCSPNCLWNASGISEITKNWTYQNDWDLYNKWCFEKKGNNKLSDALKIQQTKQIIKQLEQKPHKTPAEIDELEELRKKLQELENLAKKPTRTESNNSDKPWLIPSLVIGGIGIIAILIIAFIRKKNRK